MRAYSYCDFCDKSVRILQFLRHNCVMENLITKRIQQYLESTIHHRRKLTVFLFAATANFQPQMI